MTVREWADRLVRPEHISGLVIDVGSEWGSGEAIYSLDVNSAGDIVMWSVPPAAWPRGPVTITVIQADVLYNSRVLRHVGQDWAVYDGDVVCIPGTPYGLSPICWVTATKKPGTAWTYHFDGVVMQGDTKTDQLVVFMASEVRAIQRLEKS